ncbi:MAG: hypothetical protein ACK5N8_07660 [Alphaproteobacteria bacterium]
MLLSFLVFICSAASFAQLSSSFVDSRIKKHNSDVSAINGELWIVENNISFLSEYVKSEDISETEKIEAQEGLKAYKEKKKALIKRKKESEELSNGYRRIRSNR